MNKHSSSKPDMPPSDHQPAAYDTEGRPLYYAPPAHKRDAHPQFVHMSRAVSPVKPDISAEITAKRAESLRRYPFLNISDAEYVISEVRRHPIGLLPAALITIFLLALIGSCLVNYSLFVSVLEVKNPPSFGLTAFVGLTMMLLVALGGYIAQWVFRANRFFLTNESVIQEIQFGLFTHHEQTVSLANIEDASFNQAGLMQMMFNYGSIRLSTEGDETTYRLSFVENPKEQIATLNNAVEAFKNGRPV